ncbi:hypothetical protein [Peribacillus muralis]|uniref:hypothetical protein n=1 Tax=Peribacillus muralis TaxID=264697 RepID=UPI000A7D9D76|nr:hypothetical protein [Peribacillus muralis]
MNSRVLTFYALGGISLFGAALFPIGYVESFNLFISLFAMGIALILIAHFHKG